jgi:ADP-ribose pyrophosphatase YjhB (NUDIX family)
MDDLRNLHGFVNKTHLLMSIGVAGVNIKREKVLLVKNTKTDYWSFPGGHLHQDESLIMGLKREVLEETGKNINIVDGPIFYQYKLNNELTLLLFFYKIKFIDETERYESLNHEVNEAKWFDIKNLPEKIYENTKTIIDQFSK